MTSVALTCDVELLFFKLWELLPQLLHEIDEFGRDIVHVVQ